MSDKLDPQCRAVLQSGADFIAQQGDPASHDLDRLRIDFIREAVNTAFKAPPVKLVRDRSMPGMDANSIPVRLYTPLGAERGRALPVLVFLHGGGWVFGDLDSHDCICRYLCQGADCMVVSVDYRLSPEYKFPAGLNDALSVVLWLKEHAREIGGDPARIAIGGDSAGGNLAAVAAYKLLHEHDYRVALQWLAYPVTDLSTEHPTMEEFADGYMLTRERMRWFKQQYLWYPDDDCLDPEVSPLLYEDLSALPAALVQTAECDPLCDEGDAYAARLQDQGVPVIHERYKGMIHGFLRRADEIDLAWKALEDAATALKRAFA